MPTDRGLLLDSCILIARLGTSEEKHELAKRFLEVADEKCFAIAISALTLWELDAAIHHPIIGPGPGTLDSLFKSRPLKILPLDVELHKVCLKKIQRPVKGADRAVISTAAHYGRLLITTDEKILTHAHAFGAKAQHPQAFIDEHS